MASDMEFLQQRLALVEHEIAHPSEHRYRGQERVRPRRACLIRQNTTYRREERLVRKLLVRARPGKVLHLLTAWRQELGQVAVDHRNKHQEAIRAYDEWSQTPYHLRNRLAKPPKPPAPKYIDREGAPWIVDDAFLALLDDLIERLQKWLGEDTRS